MKTILTVLFIIAVLLTGCDKNELGINGKLTDGFCIVSNDKVVLNPADFDYYDFSAHLIYLKENKSFAGDMENIGTFKVFANREEVYSGQYHPAYSSSLPSGPVIETHPSLYGDYTVSIGRIMYLDSLGNFLPDPREDPRIVKALKKYNQFRGGLSCEIQSVQYLSSSNVKVELRLTNNDSFNYYYLDPDKTGIGLFHYFTNGLIIIDYQAHKTYNSGIEVVSADPWNTWKKEWLSVIAGNESKVITIVYDHFDEVPPGQYKATFEFPGLSSQVEKNDLVQEDGQIWLGKINMMKEISVD